MTTAPPLLLLADHQGSIVAVADASGTPVGIDRYDEWGVPDATNIGKFQYTGQVWLSDLGMYHYKARIYSPTLGRFLQTDPIGYKDQQNLYAYVGNDPVNATDPAGLERRDIIGDPCDSKEWGARASSSCSGGSLLGAFAQAADGSKNPRQGGASEPAGIGHNGGPSLDEDDLSERLVKLVLGRAGGFLALLFTSTSIEGGDLPPNVSADELNPAQFRNLTRFEKSVPTASQTTIYRLPNGNIQFLRLVKGQVPGSSATYVKIINNAGATQTFFKETIGPDGKFIHRKVKFP